MAVTALICGVVAVALCWVPLVNVLAVAAALGGLVVGAVALVLSRRGLHAGARRAAFGVGASALGLVVALVVDVIYVVQLGDRLVDTSMPPARPAPAATAPAATTPSSAESEVPSAAPPTPSAAAASTQQPLEGLALGTPARVGDYTVTITGVNTDADAVVAEASTFNKPPAGQYVVADVSVVYNGAEEGIPWVQVQLEYLGTDARNYSWTTCPATLPRPSTSQPNLRPGGASEYQVCFDLPAEAIAGGAVRADWYLPADPATWSVGR